MKFSSPVTSASSNKNPDVTPTLKVASSNRIPTPTSAPLCSASIRTTSSNSASSICVEESKPLTVPSWVVNVLPDAKVPVTSLTRKCDLGVKSGAIP